MLKIKDTTQNQLKKGEIDQVCCIAIVTPWTKYSRMDQV